MTNKLVISRLATVLLLLSLAAVTYAHHGIVAWFDMSRSMTVKGTVTSFEWTNPHSYIYFDVKDEKGAIAKWSAEMGGVPMLGLAGWRRETVKPGDEITLIGKPAKDGKHSMLLDKAILANGQELPASDVPLSPADGDKTPKE
jgi:Family of unknown function (DUF6152)